MRRRRTLSCAFLLIFFACIPQEARPQSSAKWHISPTTINVQIGDKRPFQLLDELGQSRNGGDWSIDNHEIAELTYEKGRPVLIAKAAGTVHVLVDLDGEIQSREIRVWADEADPGTLIWTVDPIGKNKGNVRASSTLDGPMMFFLDQTSTAAYLRALTGDGIQLWIWQVPEAAPEVRIVCADNFGGALVAASGSGGYTLYVVNKDGKIQWQRTFAGELVGHALSHEDLLHVLNQSPDLRTASLVGIDERSGVERFSLDLPASTGTIVNLRKSGNKYVCAPGVVTSRRMAFGVSGLIILRDGTANLAFSESESRIAFDECTLNSVVDLRDSDQAYSTKLVLWTVRSDGTVRSTTVRESKVPHASLTEPVLLVAPTGAIIPDGLGGVLLSTGHYSALPDAPLKGRLEEFVYRITGNGELAFKFPLPDFIGKRHDEMLLGEDDIGFATRGGILVAFDVRGGKEVWRWDSGEPEIMVNMATAGGGCVVATREGLVLIENGVKKEIVVPNPLGHE